MSANIEQIKAMLERTGKTNLLQSKKVDLDKERLQLEATVNIEEIDRNLEKEYIEYVEDDPVFSKLTNRNVGLAIARHFAEWQKAKTLEDAVEIEVKEDASGFPIVSLGVIELYDYENDKPLAKAGDKVKVIVIKED